MVVNAGLWASETECHFQYVIRSNSRREVVPATQPHMRRAATETHYQVLGGGDQGRYIILEMDLSKVGKTLNEMGNPG